MILTVHTIVFNPGEKCENVKFYETGGRNSSNASAFRIDDDIDFSTNFSSCSNKRGPKPKSEPIEQLFLFLTCLRCGFHWNSQAGFLTCPNLPFLVI